MKLLSRITVNPEVLFGKPTIRNKRYPVVMILDLMSAGMTTEDILQDYDDLVIDDIYACLQFAAKVTEMKSIARVINAENIARTGND